MRRNKKSGINKERIIMLASSAFVLAALTMTGVYMKGQNVESRDDGYTLDFTALPNNADDKLQEITENNDEHLLKEDENIPGLTANNTAGNEIAGTPVTEDDLDYMPLEQVDSGTVEIPGLTDRVTGQATLLDEAMDAEDTLPVPAGGIHDEAEEPATDDNATPGKKGKAQAPSFQTGDQLVWPVTGNVIIPYSMDKTVYFPTLDQYKYNPAMVISAAEGATISAVASGTVVSVFYDEEIGNAVTVEIGNGYEVTYGQLKEIAVSKGSYLEKGSVIGYVAAPTKYYSMEGTNAYFALTLNGEPADPLGQLR